MKTLNAKKILTLSLISAQALGALAQGAFAQALNVQSMSSTTNTTYVLTEDALMDISAKSGMAKKGQLFMSAQYNFLNKPLVEMNDNRTEQVGTVINNLNTLDLGVGIAATDFLQLGVVLPLNIIQHNSQGNVFAAGDSKLQAKWRLLDGHERKNLIGISLINELILPTGDKSLYLSQDSVGAGLKLAFERDFGPLKASANVGYRYSSNAVFYDIDYRHQVPLSLGIFAPIDNKWGLNFEGTTALSFSKYNNPGELYAGARFQASKDANLFAGASIGALDSNAAGNFRVVVGLKFSPAPKEEPVMAVAPVAPVAPIVKPAPVVQAAPQTVYYKKVVRIKKSSGSQSQSGQTSSSVVKKAKPTLAKKIAHKPVKRLVKKGKKASGKKLMARNSSQNEEIIETTVTKIVR